MKSEKEVKILKLPYGTLTEIKLKTILNNNLNNLVFGVSKDFIPTEVFNQLVDRIIQQIFCKMEQVTLTP